MSMIFLFLSYSVAVAYYSASIIFLNFDYFDID